MPPIHVPYTLAPGAHAPTRATPGAAGLDLYARLPSGPLMLDRAERACIGTGLRLALPPGYEGQVRPRSGLALKHGLTVLNSPGTVDLDLRGEVAVILVNLGGAPVTIRDGDRIAQLVIAPVPAVELVQAVELPATERGAGGFGSTGTGPVAAPATVPPYPSGVWEYDGPPDEAIREMAARIRYLEAAVSEARAERDKWAAELDALRDAAQAMHDDLHDARATCAAHGLVSR